MKTYSIGNRQIIKTTSYLQTEKAKKANRIFAKLIRKKRPDCMRTSICAFWPVNFNSDTPVIEKAGFKICYEKSLMHKDLYFYAIIEEVQP
jgi:hypothetical protein